MAISPMEEYNSGVSIKASYRQSTATYKASYHRLLRVYL